VAKPAATIVAPKESKVMWANIVATENCFFFSGPVGHGRDSTVGSTARLEIDGEKATLHLGEVAFHGHGLDSSYHFLREDERENEGKWKSSERIDAELSDDGLRGSYAYEECDLEGEQGCPGKCTIAADFFARGLVAEAPRPD
jgi:hypothetical protein